MPLPEFELHEPDTVEEAVHLLVRYGENARPIAGGTALVLMMRFGLLQPVHLVSLHRIPDLAGVRPDAAMLRLGSLVTHREVAGSPRVREGWPLLAAAAGRVATPAIRNMGTLGGNLCYAEAASDPAPALLCLEARVRLRGSDGERVLPLDGFFTGFYETQVRSTEILTEVEVPPPPPGAVGTYLKFSPRSEDDRPLMSVAALLGLDGEGRCRTVRIALGAAAPTPIRARQAEAVLAGQVPEARTIEAAAAAAAGEADPLEDLLGTVEYRRDMVRVWVRRALTDLTGRLPG